MQNEWRFFYAFVAMVLPLCASGQNNTKGDREQIIAKEERAIQTHRIHLTRKEKRRQRLSFKRPKVENTARYEYYKRMEEVGKEKQWMLKEMAKPQYSNFAFFGHKHKPKKHKPYEMKYCKECGIRH